MKLKKAVLLLVAMVLIAATTMSMSSCGLLFRSLLGDGDEEEAGKDSEVLDFIGSNENNESEKVDFIGGNENNYSSGESNGDDKTGEEDEVYEVIPSTEGLAFELNEDGESYTLVGIGDCESTEVVISHYNGNPVTDIASGTFQNITKLTKAIIGDSVKIIGNSAFNECSGLKDVAIGNGVNSIGYFAFSGCTSLMNLTIGNNVSQISGNAFSGCVNLMEVVIPDSVASIEGNAFSACTKLSNIHMPESVISIGANAFYNTGYYDNETNWENGVLYLGKCLIDSKSDISGNCIIKDGIINIAADAFHGREDIESITVPVSVMSIGKNAFLRYSTKATVNYAGSSTQLYKVSGVGDSRIYYCFVINYNYEK